MFGGFESLGKILMLIGGLLFAFGAVAYFGAKILPFGQLPGDFQWQRGNFQIYVPLASSILLSIVLTIILNIVFRR